MNRTRRYLRDMQYSMESIKIRNEYLKEEFIKLSGEKEYKKLINIYDTAIAKLAKEMESLPVGYRYTGIFYVKVPYSMPIEYEKINGTLFMREDLVSWRVESGVDDVDNRGYIRTAFKSPKGVNEITRKDCEPVFKEELV